MSRSLFYISEYFCRCVRTFIKSTRGITSACDTDSKSFLLICNRRKANFSGTEQKYNLHQGRKRWKNLKLKKKKGEIGILYFLVHRSRDGGIGYRFKILARSDIQRSYERRCRYPRNKRCNPCCTLCKRRESSRGNLVKVSRYTVAICSPTCSLNPLCLAN